MAETTKLYISNDHRLVLEGLFFVSATGAVTHPTTGELGDWVNDATVTARLLDAVEGGDEVSGQTWPLSLVYISGSDGDYEGVLEDSLAVSRRSKYYVEVTVDDTANGRDAVFMLEVKASIRGID